MSKTTMGNKLQWKSIATRLGIAKREMDAFEQVYLRSQKGT